MEFILMERWWQFGYHIAKGGTLMFSFCKNHEIVNLLPASHFHHQSNTALGGSGISEYAINAATRHCAVNCSPR